MTVTASSASAAGASPASPDGAGAPSRRPTGPHLGALASVSLALALAGVATAALAVDGSASAAPFGSTARLLGYAGGHGTAAPVSATLLFGSAVPLGIFAATAYTRLLRLGVRVPGPSIGFFGGVAASLLLMVSATAAWILGRPELGGDAPVARALSLLAFLTGGVGSVTGLGLLVAGVAVPALVLRLVPRWLPWAGLVVAAVCELSFLTMAIPPVQALLPLGRYTGLLWLVAIGFLLPTRRTELRKARR
jgi:hypothetical protein